MKLVRALGLAVVAAGLVAAAARPLTLSDAVPDAQGIKRLAVLRALDKITGRAVDVNAPIGRPVQFGTLTVTVNTCETRPPEETPETTAFLQVEEAHPGQPSARIFSGWMFASSPALHALEHPVYDIWLISCRTSAPAPVPAAPPALVPPPATPAAEPPASPNL